MRSFSIVNCAIVCVLVAIVVVPTSAETVVVYREIFPHDGGDVNMEGLGTTGWQAHGDLGAEYTNHGNMEIANADGYPTDAEPINSNPQYSGLERAYIFSRPAVLSGKDTLYWTDEYDGVSTDQLLDVIFYSRNTDSRDVLRVALQIDDASWYVSTTTFSNPLETAWQEHTLDVSTATWNALTFTPGSSLSRGTDVVPLGSGTVTAFGVYNDYKYYTHRIDSFTLTAVPEPGTPVLWGTGLLALGGWAWLKRRRK